MPNSNDDLSELRSLVAAIKADAQVQKDKAKGEAWVKWVSLTTVCLAVLTAIAASRSQGYANGLMRNLNEATFYQAHASDQWAYFQAKGLKQNLAELERNQLVAHGGADAKALAELAARIERYEGEKAAVSAEARDFEAKRDKARTGAAHFAECNREMGFAGTLMQIGVALSGICMVVKKRWLWFLGLAVGGTALAQMVMVLLKA